MTSAQWAHNRTTRTATPIPRELAPLSLMTLTPEPIPSIRTLYPTTSA